MAKNEFVDYYNFLMVSPQADRAIVELAVRLLLTRYGPTTPETADEGKYETTKAAYRALADPVKRGEYDRLRSDRTGANDSDETEMEVQVERRSQEPKGHKDLDNILLELDATAEDVCLQVRMRQAVLSALYDVMITNPRNPELGRGEIARAICCRIDDLEFPMWYLRESGLLRTSVTGDYSISATGVEWVESGGVPHLTMKASPQAVEEAPKARRTG